MGRVVIVPGLAVRSYAESAARELRADGHDVMLPDAPTWRGVPDDLVTYGRGLADRIETIGEPVAALVGLSVGTQAAVVTAASTSLVRHLVLVSPTVEPALRSRVRLAAAFLLRSEPGGPPLREQLPDWTRAGIHRMLHGFGSAIELPIECVLADARCPVTVVHGEHDPLTSHHWAAALAARHGARLLLVPGGSHSWPYRDAEQFAALIGDLDHGPERPARFAQAGDHHG